MKKYLFLLIILALTLSACSRAVKTVNSNDAKNNAKGQVTIYKSPTCGCCSRYGEYLEESGYDVNIIIKPDMQAVKRKYNIPANMESCHTAVFGDYFAEGHIPVEAVEKMLAEKPDIDGLSLPGMPAGSPGMPGAKTAPFEIFALTDGRQSLYMEE